MKYIRTKHTIFEVVDENENVYYVRAKSDRESVYAKSKRNTDIITEGNSIEELCDEFIGVFFIVLTLQSMPRNKNIKKK